MAGELAARPLHEPLQTQVFAGAELAGVVRGAAPEDRRRVGVGVAIQADDPSVGRGPGSGVNFRRPRALFSNKRLCV
jgi:hypothetical protein